MIEGQLLMGLLKVKSSNALRLCVKLKAVMWFERNLANVAVCVMLLGIVIATCPALISKAGS